MIVQIRKIEDYNLSEIEEAISRWFSCARNPKLKRARKVLIKPNLLGAFAPERAVTTHPLVVEAIARYFLSKNKSIIIADSNGGSANLDRVLTTCGYNYLAEKYPIRIINLSTYGVSSKDRNQYTLKISKIIGECGALINVGKLKTHSLVAYTGAIKNLYGLIPGLTKSEYHKQYPDTGSFSGLLNALYLELRDKVSYNIIDGILGMDGAGPSGGRVRRFGLLMGSESAPALDCIASRLMGFKLRSIPYLVQALHDDGILPSRIRIPTSFTDFSLPDVDIRTVLFSKELLQYTPPIARKVLRKVFTFNPLISDRCKGCGLCVSSCPVQAISWESPALPVVDRQVCIKCMCCHELCPHKAVDIEYSPLAKLILRGAK